MDLPPKAQSVDQRGEPDGFVPEPFYRPEVLGGGRTRLSVSVVPSDLGAVCRALTAILAPPLKLLYVQLTDRVAGRQLPKPRHLVAVDLSRDRVLTALERYQRLLFHDGRCQLWLQGSLEEQLVLEETGVLFAYPDDPAFRDVLDTQGLVHRLDGLDLASRDYLRVNFLADCDAEERALISDLALVEWQG